MASNQDRMKRLEELQRKKQEMEAKKASIAKAKETGDILTGRIANQTDSSTGGYDGKPAQAEVKPKKTGPVIEMKSFVGVFNIPPK